MRGQSEEKSQEGRSGGEKERMGQHSVLCSSLEQEKGRARAIPDRAFYPGTRYHTLSFQHFQKQIKPVPRLAFNSFVTGLTIPLVLFLLDKSGSFPPSRFSPTPGDFTCARTQPLSCPGSHFCSAALLATGELSHFPSRSCCQARFSDEYIYFWLSFIFKNTKMYFF